MDKERELWAKVLQSLSQETLKSVELVAPYEDALASDAMIMYLQSECAMADGLLSLDATEIDEILRKARAYGLEVQVTPEVHYHGYLEQLARKEKWDKVLGELSESTLKDLQNYGSPVDWSMNTTGFDPVLEKQQEDWEARSVNDPEVRTQMIKFLTKEVRPGMMEGLDSLDMSDVGEILSRMVFFGLLDQID